MTDRFEYYWKLDGFVEEQRCYLSENPIDTNAPPAPVAILTNSDRTHIEDGLILGKYYYTRISAYKNGVEKFSDEQKVLFGNPWNPTHLTNAAKLWIDSENVLLNGSKVTQANDLSGNNFHFMQTVDSYRPIRQFDATVNSNVIKFDGVDDSLYNLGAQAISRNISKFWTFCVYKKTSTDSTPLSRNLIVFNKGNIDNSVARIPIQIGSTTLANASSFYIRPVDGLTDNGLIVANQSSQIWNMNYYEWDGVGESLLLRQDGVSTSQATTGLATTTSDTQATVAPVMLGCGTFGTNSNALTINRGGFADISLACVLVGSGTLPTPLEMQKLEGWAAHKYGLTDNLPANHPYKILAPTL